MNQIGDTMENSYENIIFDMKRLHSTKLINIHLLNNMINEFVLHAILFIIVYLIGNQNNFFFRGNLDLKRWRLKNSMIPVKINSFASMRLISS